MVSSSANAAVGASMTGGSTASSSFFARAFFPADHTDAVLTARVKGTFSSTSGSSSSCASSSRILADDTASSSIGESHNSVLISEAGLSNRLKTSAFSFPSQIETFLSTTLGSLPVFSSCFGRGLKTVSTPKDLLLEAARLNDKASTLNQAAMVKVQGVPGAAKLQTNVENAFAHSKFARDRALRAARATTRGKESFDL
ncbi:unnamed protein product [Amoebophrya sp. A120]|nr:unnamed protein product [Amoebophrya sp. A120]|eukprot:GSA120T00000279001.1